MLHAALSFIIHSFHSSLNHYFLPKDMVCLLLGVKIPGQTSDIQHTAVLSHSSLQEKAVHKGRAPADLRDTHCEGSAAGTSWSSCYLQILHLNSSSLDQTPEDCTPQRQKKVHFLSAPKIKTQFFICNTDQSLMTAWAEQWVLFSFLNTYLCLKTLTELVGPHWT